MMRSRFMVLIWAGWAGAAIGQPAAAQSRPDAYPSRPVAIVIPFGAGSAPDIAARFWAKPLTENLGRPFVVDLKPGGGGNIASQFVAKAPPDGHALLMITGSFTITPAFGNLPFDPVKDFAAISLLSRRAIVLAVTPSLPVNTFAEYVAYAKANPDKLNWGDQGPGTSFHLAGVLLGNATGTKVTFVHYKGSAQNYTDLMAGRVHVSPMSMVSTLPLVKSGKVRVIVSLTGERSPFMPDLPTLAELGVSGYDHSSWQGLLTTAGTPAATIDRLNAAIVAFARSPAAQAAAARSGEELVGSSPEVLQRRVADEIARFRKVVREYNIQTEE